MTLKEITMMRCRNMAMAAGVMMGLAVSAVWAEEKPADSITGRVLLDGKARKPKSVDPGVDPFCVKVHKKTPIIQEKAALVGKDNALANVFVHVVSGLPDKKWPVPAEPVVLNQKGCRYVPHVFGLMAGQKLEVRNGDRTNHNVHMLSKVNKELNFAQSRQGMKKLVDLAKVETFGIKCDVHPWMNSWCHVMSHPFFAVTDKEGKFAIAGLPAGEYELECWHESGAKKKVKVKVAQGKTTKIDDVKLKMRSRRPRGSRKK